MKNVIVKAIIGIVLGSTIASCEKEIDIDYKTVEPMYVVEAEVNNVSTRVAVSRTTQITGDNDDTSINNAIINITGSDNSTLTLTKGIRGLYTSSFKGTAGVRYSIDVEIDGRHFTSESTMQKQPVINSLRFVWKKMFSTRILFADLRIEDIQNETNFYFMHIYRNGVGYRWAVMKDTSNHNAELQQLFSCMDEDSDDADDKLNEGDNIRVEVRAIDKASYDYLFSLQHNTDITTNPIMNFTGGCLGYFSAYGKSQLTCKFTYEGIEEE